MLQNAKKSRRQSRSVLRYFKQYGAEASGSLIHPHMQPLAPRRWCSPGLYGVCPTSNYRILPKQIVWRNMKELKSTPEPWKCDVEMDDTEICQDKRSGFRRKWRLFQKKRRYSKNLQDCKILQFKNKLWWYVKHVSKMSIVLVIEFPKEFSIRFFACLRAPGFAVCRSWAEAWRDACRITKTSSISMELPEFTSPSSKNWALRGGERQNGGACKLGFFERF